MGMMGKCLGYVLELLAFGAVFGVYWVVSKRWKRRADEQAGSVMGELEGPVKGPSEGCGSEKV